MAELLAKYGLPGTFYIPIRNAEGRAVLPSSELRALGQKFEIGSHTRDHMYLHKTTSTIMEEQITTGKSMLEDSLGHSVSGFAYPGGKNNAMVRAAVARAGFEYARTTENFRLDPPSDVYRISTTLQIFPHRRSTYVRNLIARGHPSARARVFLRAVAANNIFTLMCETLQLARETGGVFHIWGHSWEIDEFGLWQTLEDFLAYASREVVDKECIPNAGLAGLSHPEFAQ
ncbi:MAG: polysaccharide deacetylase family protein [Alphaproteobacteria bacterium]|nr:polysaccharide deacetylase family protein [Alphaproteobacteria bacterium]